MPGGPADHSLAVTAITVTAIRWSRPSSTKTSDAMARYRRRRTGA
jgi:hypothetical protein